MLLHVKSFSFLVSYFPLNKLKQKEIEMYKFTTSLQYETFCKKKKTPRNWPAEHLMKIKNLKREEGPCLEWVHVLQKEGDMWQTLPKMSQHHHTVSLKQLQCADGLTLNPWSTAHHDCSTNTAGKCAAQLPATHNEKHYHKNNKKRKRRWDQNSVDSFEKPVGCFCSTKTHFGWNRWPLCSFPVKVASDSKPLCCDISTWWLCGQRTSAANSDLRHTSCCIYIASTVRWVKGQTQRAECQFSHHQLPLNANQTGRTGNTPLLTVWGREAPNTEHNGIIQWCGGAVTRQGRCEKLGSVSKSRSTIFGILQKGKGKRRPVVTLGSSSMSGQWKITKHAIHALHVRHAWVTVVQRSHQRQDGRTIVQVVHSFHAFQNLWKIYLSSINLSIRLFITPASYIFLAHIKELHG